ncbi:hypothetical protein DFH09DRAFT_1334249 [Mycena vulgaris]|nr:hypothetical protein DFH09DRAFT_1334249 [Mycena vulgaris]
MTKVAEASLEIGGLSQTWQTLHVASAIGALNAPQTPLRLDSDNLPARNCPHNDAVISSSEQQLLPSFSSTMIRIHNHQSLVYILHSAPTPISTAFPSPASVLDAVDPAAYQTILAERFRSAPICTGTPRILNSRHDAAARSGLAGARAPDPLTTGARPALRPLPAGLECARVGMHVQDARSGDMEMQDVETYAAISKALPGASILAGLACTQDGVARAAHVQDAEIQDDRNNVVHKHAAISTAAEVADVHHPYIHRALASEWYNQYDHSECVYPRSRVRAGRCRFSGLPRVLLADDPPDRSFLPLLVARGMPSLPTPLTTRTATPSAVSIPLVSRLRHPAAPPLPAPGALLILAPAPRLTALPGPLAALDSPATAMRYLSPWAPSGNAATGVGCASSQTRPWITNRVKTGINSRI